MELKNSELNIKRPEFLADLNEEQLDAAETTEGSLLVIAGAGTGKTKMLISRVANLLYKGVAPSEILLLTFTKKAAKEMRDRICSFPSIENGELITATTFHSFCCDVLRRYASYIHFKNDFDIKNAEDAEDIIGLFSDEIRKKHKEEKKTDKTFPSDSEILAVHSSHVNNMTTIEKAIATDPEIDIDPYFVGDVIHILKQYRQYKIEHSMMDFDDLLYWTYVLFYKYETIRAKLDSRYRYIMCDEYQDTNLIQDHLLEMLSKDSPNLCVVGDDNQSIYRFRGALVENIISFPKRHAGCKTIKLIQNYRSTQEILDYANAVMSHATEGIKKELKGFSHGDKVSVSISRDDYALSNLVIQDIRKKLEEGIPPEEICIMGREGNTTYVIETQLDKNRIPYHKYGGRSFFAQAAVRNILAFLKALNSFDDEIAWMKLLCFIPGVGKKTAIKFFHYVRDCRNYLALEDMVMPSDRYYYNIISLRNLFHQMNGKPPSQQIDLAIKFYAKISQHQIDISKTSLNRKDENTKKLKADLKMLETLKDLAEPYISVREMLEDFALNVPEKEDDSPKINVTTIHSAKGLEYHTVYLINPVQGRFPKKDSLYNKDACEDLRCMYVALTRAKKELHICMADRIMMFGKETDGILSMFLSHQDVLDTCDCPKQIGYYLPEGFSYCKEEIQSEEPIKEWLENF